MQVGEKRRHCRKAIRGTRLFLGSCQRSNFPHHVALAVASGTVNESGLLSVMGEEVGSPVRDRSGWRNVQLRSVDSAMAMEETGYRARGCALGKVGKDTAALVVDAFVEKTGLGSRKSRNRECKRLV